MSQQTEDERKKRHNQLWNCNDSTTTLTWWALSNTTDDCQMETFATDSPTDVQNTVTRWLQTDTTLNTSQIVQLMYRTQWHADCKQTQLSTRHQYFYSRKLNPFTALSEAELQALLMVVILQTQQMAEGILISQSTWYTVWVNEEIDYTDTNALGSGCQVPSTGQLQAWLTEQHI